MPDAHAELMRILRTLEEHYKDMQDTEFTVEEGELYMLQTRSAKRPAQGRRALCRRCGRGRAPHARRGDRDDRRRKPRRPAASDLRPRRGVRGARHRRAASPGAAKGRIVFSPEDAVEWAQRGPRGDPRAARSPRPTTCTAFFAAQGILTAEGGKASHAALVARGMGKPCVAGASALRIDLDAGVMRVGDTELRAGDRIAIDGSTGRVTADDVALAEPEPSAELETVLAWADALRRLGVRANADTPEDARRARELGAEGIGCAAPSTCSWLPTANPRCGR
jgi:pyruvate,orthophosphate dikinase